MPASHLHHNMTAECHFFLPMTTSCPLSRARPPTSWDSDRFEHAFAATTLVFLGDSLADQQWRSLLCLEAQHLDHKSVSKLLDGDASTSIKTKLYCAHTLSGLELCHQRRWTLDTVLEAADALLLTPGKNLTLVMSAHAHEQNVSEAEMASRLLSWTRRSAAAASSVRGSTTLVWRTRGYDHYGAEGWTGSLERRGCAPVSEAQTAAIESDLRRARAILGKAANLLVLDAGPASAPRHEAHPFVAQGGRGSKEAYWDCRHWCQPGGPPDDWNRQLARLVEAQKRGGGPLAAAAGATADATADTAAETALDAPIRSDQENRSTHGAADAPGDAPVALQPSAITSITASRLLHWAPRTLAEPTVCLGSLVVGPSSSLAEGWSGYAAEVNCNWALAHGYSYFILREHVLGANVPITWSKVLLAQQLAQRTGADACAYSLILDADAIVHTPSRSVGALIERFFLAPRHNTPPLVLFTSHEWRTEPGADDASSLGCACLRSSARCSAAAILAEQAVFKCSINTGVFLVRNPDPGALPRVTHTEAMPDDSANSTSTLPLLQYWLGAGGRCCMRCHQKTMEQRCTKFLKASWPAQIDVVNSRLFNTLGEACLDGTDPARNGSLICHLMGVPPDQRLHAFERELAARRGDLRALLEARGERYVQIVQGGGGAQG